MSNAIQTAVFDHVANKGAFSPTVKNNGFLDHLLDKNAFQFVDEMIQILLARVKCQGIDEGKVDMKEMTDMVTGIYHAASSAQNNMVLRENTQAFGEANLIQRGNLYLGKEIFQLGDTLNLNGELTRLAFSAPQNISKGILYIKDQEGNVVKTINISNSTKDMIHYMVWDGKDDAGERMDDGQYAMEIQAFDENDDLLPVQTFNTTKVTGFEDFDGKIKLYSEQAEINPGGSRRLYKTI